MIRQFGKTKMGEEASLYTLKNKNQMEVHLTDYGAAVVSVLFPDRKGVLLDVVLGYDDVSGYEKGDAFFGATVGRVANRIKGAAFVLNDQEYRLDQNDQGNNLHSGWKYYNKRMWRASQETDFSVTFTLCSAHMDQGYPGKADIHVTYTLTDRNQLKIRYEARAENDTIINMTNHSYFNLAGEGAGDVLDQEAWIFADKYTRADAQSIPTGEMVLVEGTPMDFRYSKKIGRDIEEDYEALVLGQGYDHNWVLKGMDNREVAGLYCDASGICMQVYTDLPGMQFYTGNYLEQEPGKQGKCYERRQGVCFETQYFPDAVNQDSFPSPLVKAGETYTTQTTFQFSLGKK